MTRLEEYAILAKSSTLIVRRYQYTIQLTLKYSIKELSIMEQRMIVFH